jgi:hypothetical protein
MAVVIAITPFWLLGFAASTVWCDDEDNVNFVGSPPHEWKNFGLLIRTKKVENKFSSDVINLMNRSSFGKGDFKKIGNNNNKYGC